MDEKDSPLNSAKDWCKRTGRWVKDCTIPYLGWCYKCLDPRVEMHGEEAAYRGIGAATAISVTIIGAVCVKKAISSFIPE